MEDIENGFAPTTWRVIGRLGVGGTARVFEVEHKATGLRCAAKVLHPNLARNAEFLERMRREARTMGTLGHPGIPRFHGFEAFSNGTPYIVTERLVGATLLDELEKRGSLPWREAVGIVRQTASALIVAHASGIVHRDLKPANLFLHDLPKGSRTVKVLDWGVAKELNRSASDQYLTEEGCVVGTPGYLAPEQLEGSEIDGRADVFSLALVLHEMISGTAVFASLGTKSTEILTARQDLRSMTLPRPRGVPRSLERVLRRALTRDRERRYASMQAFDRALQEVLEGDAARLKPLAMIISACATFAVLSALSYFLLGALHDH